MNNICKYSQIYFKNFNLESTTRITSTTTDLITPPACEVGNLDDRVCRIEGEIEEFHGNFQNINNELEDLRRQIAELKVSCNRN